MEEVLTGFSQHSQLGRSKKIETIWRSIMSIKIEREGGNSLPRFATDIRLMQLAKGIKPVGSPVAAAAQAANSKAQTK
jgi:hypothetical protein